MGELVAVLNGVEFRTRHNDYKMRMPHRTSQVYGATEDVPYPDVPPEVTTPFISFLLCRPHSRYTSPQTIN